MVLRFGLRFRTERHQRAGHLRLIRGGQFPACRAEPIKNPALSIPEGGVFYRQSYPALFFFVIIRKAVTDIVLGSSGAGVADFLARAFAPLAYVMRCIGGAVRISSMF